MATLATEKNSEGNENEKKENKMIGLLAFTGLEVMAIVAIATSVIGTGTQVVLAIRQQNELEKARDDQAKNDEANERRNQYLSHKQFLAGLQEHARGLLADKISAYRKRMKLSKENPSLVANSNQRLDNFRQLVGVGRTERPTGTPE